MVGFVWIGVGSEALEGPMRKSLELVGQCSVGPSFLVG